MKLLQVRRNMKLKEILKKELRQTKAFKDEERQVARLRNQCLQYFSPSELDRLMSYSLEELDAILQQ